MVRIRAPRAGRIAIQGPEIVVVENHLAPPELRRLVERCFGDMVKFVVDLERGAVAVGGELHSDAEALLLEAGSNQDHLWGGNYYPGRGREHCIEFTSMINLRPALDNRSMFIEDPNLRERVKALVHGRIGEGEPLP